MTEGHPATLVWSPKPALVVWGWVLAVALLALAVAENAPEGRILAGIGTLAAGLFALFGTVARPRLRADGEGVAIRRLGGSAQWRWPQLTIRISRTRRLGRESSLLELDAVDEDGDEHLIVLGWLDLGADPADVAAALRNLSG
jgi:hypothetical protein